MDYTFFRDCGAAAMMPYLCLMPSAVLVMGLIRWERVSDEERGQIKLELDRRKSRQQQLAAEEN